jgi:hypothetical protein
MNNNEHERDALEESILIETKDVLRRMQQDKCCGCSVVLCMYVYMNSNGKQKQLAHWTD